MKIAVSRRFGRLFYCLAPLALLLGPGSRMYASEPAKTLISDVIYRADGTPASGTLLVSWPAFTTAEGKAVAAGTSGVKIGAGGAVALHLVPNEGATPAGTYYKVTLKLDDGSIAVEYWTVPRLSPTTISAIRASVVPAGVAAQMVSRTYLDAELAQTVHRSGDENVDGVKTFNSSPLVPEPTSDLQAANKQYVDAAAAGGGSSILALSRGGTGQNTWTAARCVRVADDGSKLEPAAGDCGSGTASDTDTVDGQHAAAFAGTVHSHTKSAITDWAHSHVKADIGDFPSTWDWLAVSNKPAAYPPEVHNHVKAQITDWAHSHLKADISDFAHTHVKANITDFPTSWDWGAIANKPSTFSPSPHGHAESEVTNLTTDLAAKAADAAVVHNSGDETIAGTKTFSSAIAGSVSGNAGTATALAANGSNCSAGQAAGGVDASGNAEGCFTPSGSGDMLSSSANTMGAAGKIDMSASPAADGFTVPRGAGAAPAGAGRMAYDSTANVYRGHNGTAAKTFAYTDSNITGTAAGLSANVAESQVTNLTADLAAKEATANKGAANGYASLDASAQVPAAQIPDLAESKVTNLTSDLAAKAAEAAVVHNSGDETIAGTKTFSSTIAGSITGTAAGLGAQYVDWNAASGGASIANKPSLGTAAALNVPASGNAAAGEVVKGSDTRLSDTRIPTAHTHAESEVTNLATDLGAKAPINNPTFSGTVGGITKSMVGLGNVDNTSDASKPVSTATQTALDAKAPINNPTFSGTVGGITKSMVGLGNVDNTSDANKPVSTAQQTALDAKLASASLTSTLVVSKFAGGACSGYLKSDGSCDAGGGGESTPSLTENTSDITSSKKLIAPSLELNGAGPTIWTLTSGTNSSPVSGDFWNDSDALKFRTSGGATKNLAFTDSNISGTAAGITGMSNSGNGTVIGTAGATRTAGKQVQFDASGNLVASSYDVGAAGGGAPGGSGSEIQYRAGASTFGAVSGSSVSGSDVTFGGKVASGGAGAAVFYGAEGVSPTAQAAGSYNLYVNSTSHQLACELGASKTNCMPSAGSANWGSIGGTLSNQTDLQTALDAKVSSARMVNGHALSADVTVTKSDVGLGNADNTSDANKPVSTATQTALDGKVDKGTATWPSSGTVATTSSNVATATALATNGTNCPGGQAAAGVDASGNAEGCFAPSGSGNVTAGTLTSNRVPKASGATAIADSVLSDDGTSASYSGTGGIKATAGPVESGGSGGGVLYGPTAASAPANPTAGNFKLWVDAAGNLNCKRDSAGTSCVPTGGSMTWPGAAGIAVYSGSSSWGTSLTAPSGTIVGTTDSQELSNKSFGAGMTWPTFNQNTTGTAAGLSGQYVDWNASSGGSSIANKPSLGDAAAKNTGTASGTVAAGDDSRFTKRGTLTWTVGGQIVSGVYTLALHAPMGISSAAIVDLEATLDTAGSASSTVNVQRCTANCQSTTPTFGNIYATGLGLGNTVRNATCSVAGTCGTLTSTINAGDQFKLNVSAVGAGNPADLTVTLTYTYQ